MPHSELFKKIKKLLKIPTLDIMAKPDDLAHIFFQKAVKLVLSNFEHWKWSQMKGNMPTLIYKYILASKIYF